MKKIAIVGPIPRDHIVTHQGDLIQKWGCVAHPVIALSTMVGDAIFPAAIHSQETSYKYDFRMDMGSAHVEAVRLPLEVEEHLHEDSAVKGELSHVLSQLPKDIQQHYPRDADGRYTALEIDEAYDVVVLDEGEEKAVISGGEEDVANLVLRLSLSQMIAERAGYPLSLLVLDEVFGSLDVARRENVVRLLRRLEDRFEQVILITHLEEIRGALDHVLRVDFDERTGASVAVWEAGKQLTVDS